MIAAGLLYLSLFAVAAGMPRHAPHLLGRWNLPALATRLPAVGWTLLLLSLAASLLARDWPGALVGWFGVIPLAAGIILLGLTYRVSVARLAAAIALWVVVIGLSG